MTARAWKLAAVVSLATLAWAAVLLHVAGRRLDGDLRGFLLPGLRWYHHAAFDDIAIFGPRGYDGEFYAMLAPDPLLLRADTAWGLDAPTYRARRVGVPLVAWILAGGHGVSAIRLHQFLCWALALAAVAVGAAWLQRLGRSPWWALALAPSAGVAASVLRTTPDGAAAGLIVIALYLHQRERRGAALLTATFATLVRETSFLVALALAWTEWRDGRRRQALAFVMVPLAVMAAWQVRLLLRFGSNLGAPLDVVAPPLTWLGPKLDQVAALPSPALSSELWWTLAVLLTALAAVGFLAGRTRTAPERATLLFSLLALLLGWKVYVEAWASARALVMLPPLALLVAASAARPARRLAFGAAVGLSAVAGVLLVRPVLLEARVSRQPIRIAANAAAPNGLLPNRLPPDLVGALAGPGGSLSLAPFVHDPPGGQVERRTDLELVAAAGAPVAVRFELLRADGRNYPWPCRVRLGPGQKLLLQDAAQRLFGSTGTFGLSAVAESGAVSLRYRTRDSRANLSGTWSPSLRLPSGP